MRYVVGYAAHDRGLEGLRLGISMARAFDAELDVVLVVRRHDPYSPAYPPVGHEETLLAAQAEIWLEEACAHIPEDVKATTHVRFGPSSAAGLERAALDFGARCIVIGGSSASRIRRHALGAVAAHLLHSSPVPVALAPRGYTGGVIGHIDAAVGTRPGAQQVLDEAVQVAVRTRLPLRLVTLVDGSTSEDRLRRADDTRAEITERLRASEGRLGTPSSVTVDVSTGSDIREAVTTTRWDESALLLVGSSRLAQGRRLFLGNVASRMLRELSIPVVVVPRPEEAVSAS